ncbi:MAG: Hpt domain-containing protein [Gammaproteobacteria bacterium]|nr:Hpt domain-containing protein [Gammaproteobacteria bacterium]
MNDINAIDTSAVETLKGLMKDRFGVLIETFLTKTTEQLNDLQIALSNDVSEDIISITHSLKGSCSSVGAISMYQLSKNYEDLAHRGEHDNTSDWAESLEIEFKQYKDAIQNYL